MSYLNTAPVLPTVRKFEITNKLSEDLREESGVNENLVTFSHLPWKVLNVSE
jgi:hypothetical protein